MTDMTEIPRAIAEVMTKGGAPLSDDQYMLLCGCLAVYQQQGTIGPYPESDLARLIKFAAVQGLELRDQADCVDRSSEAFRALPDHLQRAINEEAEALDNG